MAFHLPLSELLLLLLLLLVAVFAFLQQQLLGRTRKNKLPPGPRKLPVIGNLHQLGVLPHHSLNKLSIRHGPLMFLQLGCKPAVVVSSADMLREVVRDHDLAFSGRPSQYAAKRISYGCLDVAFAPYGEHWRQVRKISVLKLLSAKRVQSFRGVREEEVASLVDAIARSSSPAEINLSELTLNLANNITCRTAFGSKYGAGYEEEERRGKSKLHAVLEETQELLGGFWLADFFPWMEWIHALDGRRARLEKVFKELDGIYDLVIEDHISTTSSPDDSDQEDFVHVLLRLHKDPVHGATFSSTDHIKGVLTDMFIAGTDTSSATLVWTMTELVRNPRVMKKVQQEVRKIVGNNKGMVEESDLQQLDYLQLVIKEALRLHPPAPLLVPRETTEACEIKGYAIPSKTRVFINATAIGMDPSCWERPEDFWPERFLDNPVDFRGQDFQLTAFGVGRRSCPGLNFAMVVVELALANLLHRFDWGLPVGMEAGDLNMEEATGITVHKKFPLLLVATTPGQHI